MKPKGKWILRYFKYNKEIEIIKKGKIACKKKRA
jgi:hypothetical protein